MGKRIKKIHFAKSKLQSNYLNEAKKLYQQFFVFSLLHYNLDQITKMKEK